MELEDLNQLVKRAKAGDKDAFSLIYEEFAEKLWRFILLKVSDKRSAEEILQDVFIKIWQGLPNLKLAKLNFSAWVYKICANTVNDYYRKVYRRPEEVLLNYDILAETHENPVRDYEQLDSKEFVKKALSNLPTSFKQVLELRFLQEFSIKETAKIMSKSSTSVRVLQHRAFKKLSEIFKDYESR